MRQPSACSQHAGGVLLPRIVSQRAPEFFDLLMNLRHQPRSLGVKLFFDDDARVHQHAEVGEVLVADVLNSS